MAASHDFRTRYGAWAVVVGASEGLGAAFAGQLAERGMNLLLLARRDPLLAAVEKRIQEERGVEVRRLAIDVADPALGAKLADATRDLDVGVLVYNAAFVPIGPFVERSERELRQVVDVNIAGPLVSLHQLLPPMLARGRGAVVLMSSLSGLQGSPRIATYAASKAFNTILAEGLWGELGERGIDVLASCAGAISTPNYAETSEKTAPGTLDPTEVARQTLDALGKGPRVVPGFVNRIASILTGRLLPRKAAVRLMAANTKDLLVSETQLGFLAPWFIYAGLFALHLLLPAREVEGYVRHETTGELLRYRLNGLRVLLAAVALWWAAGYAGLVGWDWLWRHRWEGVAGACSLGLLLSAAVVLTAPGTGKPLLADLFLGRRENPQMLGGRADAKMLLYLVGAVLLELNLLSFAAHHFAAFPDDPSPGVALHVALFSWFVCEYLFFERVHLYTYDLFAERLGFKLVWGCLTWYPYFYAVGLWSTADRPNPQSSTAWLVMSAVIFFAGWSLARGANMQKFSFKRDPTRLFLGRKPEALGDGDLRVLCNGFWGVSRHVNYLGEVLMATGLALSLGWPLAIGPWLYPLYYVVLLGTRERDDDRRCAEKYGAAWTEYRERVRWRIVPGVY